MTFYVFLSSCTRFPEQCSAQRQMCGVPEANSTHCQQHNSTSSITLRSVNRLRRSTTTHEVRRTRPLLRRSSCVEFTSYTSEKRWDFYRLKGLL